MWAASVPRSRLPRHLRAATSDSSRPRAVKHLARKRFGQNFLIDQFTIAAIVAAIHPAPGECLVEIGPGLGALTRPLLAAAGQLNAIEIDRDLARALKAEFGARLNLHEQDVLDFDFADRKSVV